MTSGLKSYYKELVEKRYDGSICIDLTDLSDRKKYLDRWIYSNKIDAVVEMVPNLSIYTYYGDGKDQVLLFTHSYLSTYRFWKVDPGPVDIAPMKLDIEDPSKIWVKYDRFMLDYPHFKEMMKPFAKYDDLGSSFTIQITQFKLWDYLKKTMRQVRSHLGWMKKYGRFPKIVLRVNKSEENYFFDKTKTTWNYKYYDAPIGERSIEIFAEHPTKKHIEWLFKGN